MKKMKVMIGYPPLPSPKGVPLLSQNRQFQWFNAPTYIYPMIPAYAATMLKNEGFEVVWADGIAEEWSQDKFLEVLEEEQPDILMVESKTPVIERHWKFLNYIKSQPEFKNIKTVLVGDHVTALPEESLKNSAVDYILTGGDYDFGLLNLADHFAKGESLEPGVYWREKVKTGSKSKEVIKNTGPFQVKHSLEEVPVIDRELTHWWLYAYKNGNYKYTPGTYTMIGRDCWWRRNGGCTFCAWTSIYPTFRTAPVKTMLKEVENAIKLGVKEVFDDTGTFPIGKWLEDFCKAMIKKGYHKKIAISCNMRAKGLTKEQYQLMGQAGFRFLLYGLESASQRTLDMLNKGTQWDDIVTATRWASDSGLSPHITCMVGYPWETKEEAQSTINLSRELFDKGYVKTLQATIVIPYPGTALFKQCQKEGWLLYGHKWSEYDMRKPVMKSPIPLKEINRLTQSLYKSFLTPRFIWREISSVRNLQDIKYLLNAGWRVLGHLKDFMAPKRLPKEETT